MCRWYNVLRDAIRLTELSKNYTLELSLVPLSFSQLAEVESLQTPPPKGYETLNIVPVREPPRTANPCSTMASYHVLHMHGAANV